MTWLLLGIAVCVVIAYRYHIAQLRRRIRDLRIERDELWEFVATVAPESLPEIDA